MKINSYENLNFVKWAGGKGQLISQLFSQFHIKFVFAKRIINSKVEEMLMKY